MAALGKDAGADQRPSLELDLHRDESAPGVARAATAGLCEQAGLTVARRQTLLLLVSEIVTNAVLHSKASSAIPITLTADADQDRVRVDVYDGGPDFAQPPLAARPFGGWGLHLLDREASDWGVRRSGGTLVWFELSLDGRLAAEG